MMHFSRVFRPLAVLALVLAPGVAHAVGGRVGDLVTHEGDVPRRLVGYGIVTGLDGSGDRTFGSTNGAAMTVRSVVNLLRRFDIEVPAEQLRLRNVAAVLVTAEVSPWLRAGGRFEVQVSAMGDASSLRGGVLWITPLVSDPGAPPTATAQGPLMVAGEDEGRLAYLRRGNSARIPRGGVLEADPPPLALAPHLLLRDPDLESATRIAEVVNAAFGAGVARVDDPGRVTLQPAADRAQNLSGFLAAVDTLGLEVTGPARIVIDSRAGTVVAGGAARVGPAAVTHHGITLQVGGTPQAGAATPGFVQVLAGALVEDVAAGLHAAGARADEMVAIFEALEAAGALNARVVVR